MVLAFGKKRSIKINKRIAVSFAQMHAQHVADENVMRTCFNAFADPTVETDQRIGKQRRS